MDRIGFCRQIRSRTLTPAEAELLERLFQALALVEELDRKDCESIRATLEVLIRQISRDFGNTDSAKK